MSADRSQFYNSFLGQTKTKFSFENHLKAADIAENNLFKWASNNMYRTSYHDMAKKVCRDCILKVITLTVILFSGLIRRKEKHGHPKIPRLCSKPQVRFTLAKEILRIEQRRTYKASYWWKRWKNCDYVFYRVNIIYLEF